MECTEVASKKVQVDSHNVSTFPAGHADLHLGDMLFFKIGDIICGRNPTTFSQVVGVTNDPIVSFPCQNIADMFTKMALNDLSNSQSPKDLQLPPHDSLVYKPIKSSPLNPAC
ncbi:hypothetical protein DSO57_1012997 [Entomophthora muscae]|uniref:Uncharacterized protein n=1 Tax=Entomophthora muscae TaxID=34485 RepID=A0ACC2UF65_9FUNG|nr:hypothetical protein DSO57_1012997 [Entomophthora muscae]